MVICTSYRKATPMLARCSVEAAVLCTTDDSVPTGKQWVFVAAANRRPSVTLRVLSAKLTMWKSRLQQHATLKPGVGALLGPEGQIFRKRLQGEKGGSGFVKPTITLAHAHIMSRRPPLEQYQPHPAADGPLASAQDLSLWHAPRARVYAIAAPKTAGADRVGANPRHVAHPRHVWGPKKDTRALVLSFKS